MVDIIRRYHFESAHRLPKVPPTHRCFKMHGHNYQVKITVRANAVDERGFVMDFFELDARVNPIIATIDHQILNEVGIENPTAENIAWWFFQQLEGKFGRGVWVWSIKVFETKDCAAYIDRNAWLRYSAPIPPVETQNSELEK